MAAPAKLPWLTNVRSGLLGCKALKVVGPVNSRPQKSQLICKIFGAGTFFAMCYQFGAAVPRIAVSAPETSPARLADKKSIKVIGYHLQRQCACMQLSQR
jgi:hypothetical protein